MRAVILEGFNSELSVMNVEPARPGPSQVVVRIGASGVCHSDLSVAHGNYPLSVPLVAGHEGAGVVIEVGSEVSRIKPGDHVIASFWPACGECFYCNRDKSFLCESPEATAPFSRASVNGQDLPPQFLIGTMAETMTVHEDFLVKVQTDLPFEQLALIGCGVTTGLGASLWTAKIEPGASVTIFGAGGVGISAVQGAKIAGAAEIIVVDPAPAKKALALSFGATHFVDPTAHDPIEQIKMLTGGRGTDYSIEVVGITGVMAQAYAAARRGGTVVFVGALKADKTLTFQANDLHHSAKRIVGCMNGSSQVRADFSKIIRLVETGRLDLDHMISRRYPLEGINEAFDAMMAGEVVRSVLIP